MTKQCESCGVLMTGVRGNRKFCSERCRKDQYRGECVDCGGKTDGTASGAKRPAIRCRVCAARYQSENAVWNKETVVAAMRRWREKYGCPPSATDWNPSMADTSCTPETASIIRKRFYADHNPPVSAVQRVFGSWNAAMDAAGFAPRGPGQRDVIRRAA